MDQITCQTPADAAASSVEQNGSGGATDKHVEICARRLTALARRIDEFVGAQLKKIETAYTRLEREAANYARLEQKSQELRQQQIEWEQKRADQAARIAEELEILTLAWDRIEAERRTLLSADIDSPPAKPEEAESPPTPPMPESAMPAPLSFFDFESSTTGRSAALQFQQIKREIRQHARRHRS